MYEKEVAIAGIVVLEAIALWQGINGVILAAAIGIIAGIAGYEIRVLKEMKKNG